MRESPWSPNETLPLVLSPEAASEGSVDFLVEWLGQERQKLTRRLETVGAVLFRGFDVTDAAEFEEVVRAFQPTLRSYVEGQSQRERISDKIYNSTYYPASERITLHNELSYTQCPPRNLFFCCATAAADGGETPIVDCRRLLRALGSGVLEAFRGRGILYAKNMHGGRGFGKSWQEHFETDDPRQVEDYFRANDVEYEWRPDRVLRTRQVRAAITRHPTTHEEIWFNQATLWHVSDLGEKARALLHVLGEANLPTHAYFENGDPIDERLLASVREATWREATLLPWERGDVLFLDNHLVAHGRNAYSGDRLILVAMA